MNNEYGFRVGFQPFMLTPPAGTPAGMAQYQWTLDECERLGARAISFMPYFIPEGAGPDTLKEMAAMAKEKDVKMIMYAFTTWALAGKCEPLAGTALGQLTDPAAARAGVEKMVGLAKIFGADVLCSGYNGSLVVRASRWSKEFPFSEQRKHIIKCLKEMSKILDGTGLVFGFENHCDFTGKEMAGMIEEVGENNIRIQYDFGNGAIACCDPMEDVSYLAPYTVSAHFKDFKVIDNPLKTDTWPDMPMRTTGCYLGEGIIDFDVILQAIIDKAPDPRGLCLLAEPAFQLPETEEEKNDLKEFDRKVTRQYVKKMQEIVQRF